MDNHQTQYGSNVQTNPFHQPRQNMQNRELGRIESPRNISFRREEGSGVCHTGLWKLKPYRNINRLFLGQEIGNFILAVIAVLLLVESVMWIFSDLTVGIVMLIFAVCIALAPIVTTVRLRKDVTNIERTFTSDELLQIDRDLYKLKEANGCYVTDKAILSKGLGELKIISMRSVLWIYIKQTNYYTNGIPTGVGRQIVVRGKNGEMLHGKEQKIKGKKDIEELMQKIKYYRSNGIIWGYTKELEEAYEFHHQDLIRLSESS